MTPKQVPAVLKLYSLEAVRGGEDPLVVYESSPATDARAPSRSWTASW